MIKILLVIDSLTCGGKERRLVELLKGLKNYSHIQCELVVMSRNVFYTDVYDLGVKIHHLDRRIKKDPRIFFNLYKICKNFRPDIIHSWSGMESIYAAPVAKLLKIKLINGMITHATPGSKKSKAYRYSRLSFPFSDVIVANSFAGLRLFQVSERKKCCIQNGFDFARMERLKDKDSVKREFGIETSRIVGMVGALNERRKDHDTLIAAAEILLSGEKDLTFLFVGAGESRDRYEESIKTESKDKIKFLGSQKDIESIINIFDVAVLATYFEGFSNVILEYMAMAKPVVATNTGGNPEIVIDGKTGYLVPKKDPEALAQKIRYLLDNPEIARAMGVAGHERVKEFFSLDIMVGKFDKLYGIVHSNEKQDISKELKELSAG